MWAHWPIHRIQLNWLHEPTSTNMGTWAYQPKPEYNEHISPNMSTWAYELKHDYMGIPAQTRVHEHISPSMSIPARTWVHEYISPNMSTWAYQPMQLCEGTLAIFYMWAHWPIHRIHEIVGNSKDVSILYEITGDCWQRYYMILHRIQLYWLHEHTGTNMDTWAYQPKHEYMSILAQTWVHEHTSPNMSTWAYQPKHEYMSILAQTWVHEHTSPNMSTWAY